MEKAYHDLSKIKKAIGNYEQALKILREVGDRRDEGYYLGNMGNAYRDLREPKKAIELL
jgi:tetratricopeptide (TPR) repeat protein